MTSSHQRGNFLDRIGPTVATWQSGAVGKSSQSSHAINVVFLQKCTTVQGQIDDPTSYKISHHLHSFFSKAKAYLKHFNNFQKVILI